MAKKLGFMVGSLRKDSWSRKIARELIELAPDDFEIVTIKTGDLPLYNEDFDHESTLPETWATLRKVAQELDGIVLVTPEYNRSIPANLKNALDIGSRPLANNVWDRLPALIVSQSTGALGGFGAAADLHKVLNFLNMPTMLQPEVYLSRSQDLFNNDSLNEGTKKFLKTVLADFSNFIEQNPR